MNEEDQISAAYKSSKTKWVVLASVILFLVLAFKFLLPSGYSDDLSRIGKGQPALVLVRDNQTVQSHELIDVMDGLRKRYVGKVEFLLTDHNTPTGETFMAENQATRATLVLMDAQGKKVKSLQAPQTEESLAQELDAVLGSPQ
jgi:thioredoxin-like negative regulator of GroEL